MKLDLVTWPAFVVYPMFRVAGFLTRPLQFRGVGTLSKQLGRILPPAKVRRSIFGSSTIEFDLMDYYWSREIFCDFDYEPEVRQFLNENLDSDSAFLDCGANIGYWSIFASEILPPQRVVAVEAAAGTYERLKLNSSLNGNRFACLNRAVSNTSGREALFETDAGHASAHLSDSSGEPVITVTIDDLVAQHLLDFRGHVLIKLDVEGAETDALKGASRLLANNRVSVIYEDHGNDPSSAVTKYVLEVLKLRVYDPADSMRPIRDKGELAVLKADKGKGYNFVATNYDFNG